MFCGADIVASEKSSQSARNRLLDFLQDDYDPDVVPEDQVELQFLLAPVCLLYDPTTRQLTSNVWEYHVRTIYRYNRVIISIGKIRYDTPPTVGVVILFSEDHLIPFVYT